MINKDEYVLSYAKEEDFKKWMELVNIVKSNFPGFEKIDEYENYKKILKKNILRKTALCVKFQNIIVGAAIYSINASYISWLAVHPNHKRKGIASMILDEMLSQFPNDKDIFVTTFRENDEKGIAPRNLYKKHGFEEAELLIEFNYPQQKFILPRKI